MDLTLSDLTPGEHEFAAGVLGRAYRDAPLSHAIYGGDPDRRLRAVQGVMRLRLSTMGRPPLIARRDDTIIGVCGIAPPGACESSAAKQLQEAPSLVNTRSRTMMRTLEMVEAWEKRHPQESHWHPGPVGVEPDCRRLGIGALMMQRFCELTDAGGGMAWLETDQPGNVRFFERFGFATVIEEDVLGIPNWYMRREPRAEKAS